MMDIEEQKTTFDYFIKYSIRSVLAIVLVMAFLGAFVA